MVKWMQLIIAEVLLGYLLQCGGCMVGICAVAKRRIRLLPLILCSVVFALGIYFIRRLGSNFNYGVHTMIMLLFVNLLCVFVLKIDVRSSILGSLLVTAIVLAGELIDLGILMVFFDSETISARMNEDPVFKAWAAVPGNFVLLAITTIAYLKRTKKEKA